MIRLVKYLKPYLLLILLAIVLLFVQANADLALPDYLSRIVNNGIQQGGVADVVPTALRGQLLDRLNLFLTPDEQARVAAAYTRVEPNSPAAAELQRTLPVVATEPVYTLNAISANESAALEPVLAKALVAVSGLEQAMADPARAAQLAQAGGFDLSRLPPGADLFALLRQLPAAQRAQLGAGMERQFAALGEKAVKQAAVSVVQAEYRALGMDMGRVQNNYIVRTGLIMLLITLLSITSSITVGYLSARTAGGLARDLRRDVFRRVESFSSTDFERFSTASLITRTTNDVTQLQTLVVMMIRMVFYAPIMGVGGIIRAVNKDSSMWWLLVVAVALLISLVAIVFSLSLPRFKIMQKLIDRLNLVLRENLSGMMVIRSFNMQRFEEQRFEVANADLTRTNLFVTRVMAGLFPAMMLILNLLTVAILWIGSHQVAQAQMQVGDMIAFMQYAMQIVFSFLMMSIMFIIFPRASVSGTRIAEVLETPPSIRDPQTPVRFPEPFNGVVEFRNVSFRYPDADENVLCNINFTARPGQTTAFIGSTGSGKSTVINLIPRFFDVTEGEILIDGVDIRDVTQHDLRAKVGFIPQKSTLFSGTIESNLRYGADDAPPAVIEQAAEIAQVSEFIGDSPLGLAKEISQGGANVSGGQKQRLSIARALVKQAPIYIFDDSFSALDFKTDAALRRALRESAADSTLLIVTQRVSTIMHAEQIVVLNEGEVVGIGSHRTLMDTCETYREIALSQLSAEELS